MRVRDLMRTSVVTANLDATVADVRSIAEAHGIRHMPIVRGGGLVGIVCLCDLEGSGGTQRISEVMQWPVLTVGADVELDLAASMMSNHGIGCLPVVQDGRVFGIVSRGDLERAGVPREELFGDRTCATCGSHHELETLPNMDFVFFCRRCLEGSGPHRLGDELGEAD